MCFRSYNGSFHTMVTNLGYFPATYTSQSLLTPLGLDMDMTVVVASMNSDYEPGWVCHLDFQRMVTCQDYWEDWLRFINRHKTWTTRLQYMWVILRIWTRSAALNLYYIIGFLRQFSTFSLQVSLMKVWNYIMGKVVATQY